MGYYIFFFFLISSFFIVYIWGAASKFSTIFVWDGSTFAVREDYTKNYNVFLQSGEVYECGFSGVEEPLKRVEVQYFVLSIFFIIYEIEFLLLLPVFSSIENLTLNSLLVVILSFLIILVSYWYEWDFYVLNFSY